MIGEGSFPGPYNRELFPYFDEILRALSPDDPCRFVTLMGSAQIGKTTMANIFTCGSLVMGKGNFLYVPSDRRQRAALVEDEAGAADALDGRGDRDMFPQRTRDIADSVTYKERKDGLATLLITGANSPASLSQVTIHSRSRTIWRNGR